MFCWNMAIHVQTKWETSIFFSKNSTVSICIYTQFVIYPLIPTNKNTFFLRNMKGRELPTQTVASSEHLQEENSS